MFKILVLFSAQSSISLVIPETLHENNLYDFTCSATGGVPTPLFFIWELSGGVNTGCTTQTCGLNISRNSNDATLSCQEVQVEYQEGGSDRKPLTVLCKIIKKKLISYACNILLN